MKAGQVVCPYTETTTFKGIFRQRAVCYQYYLCTFLNFEYATTECSSVTVASDHSSLYTTGYCYSFCGCKGHTAGAGANLLLYTLYKSGQNKSGNLPT